MSILLTRKVTHHLPRRVGQKGVGGRVVKYLLAGGVAHCYGWNRDGDTPIHIACRVG